MVFRYRFMVIDRLGVDLQKKFEECGKKFPKKLVLQLGLRLVSPGVLRLVHQPAENEVLFITNTGSCRYLQASACVQVLVLMMSSPKVCTLFRLTVYLMNRN